LISISLASFKALENIKPSLEYIFVVQFLQPVYDELHLAHLLIAEFVNQPIAVPEAYLD
jgi:hypothetical protein